MDTPKLLFFLFFRHVGVRVFRVAPNRGLIFLAGARDAGNETWNGPFFRPCGFLEGDPKTECIPFY